MIKNQKFTNLAFKIKTALFALTLLLSLIPLGANAEYRVFQYWVKTKSREKAELITTSLDPKAYLAYYGNEKETSINLMRSWICYGDTGGHQTPCRFEETNNLPTEVNGESKTNEGK